jgi:hypothetical protein
MYRVREEGLSVPAKHAREGKHGATEQNQHAGLALKSRSRARVIKTKCSGHQNLAEQAIRLLKVCTEANTGTSLRFLLRVNMVLSRIRKSKPLKTSLISLGIPKVAKATCLMYRQPSPNYSHRQPFPNYSHRQPSPSYSFNVSLRFFFESLAIFLYRIS